MFTLDLFNSSFEKNLHEGAIDQQLEAQEPPKDPRTTPDNATRTQAVVIFQDMQRAFKRQQPVVTLEWPGQGQATLTRNQMFSVLREIINKPTQVQNRWIPILGNRQLFLNKLGTMQMYKAPIVRMAPEPGQQKLDLDEKKNSKEQKYKDVAVQRAMRKAAAEFPSAASDSEAFAKSMMVQQDQDQENINRLKSGLTQQRDLLNKNAQLDKTQDHTINDLNQEIHNVEKQNASLERTIQQMQAANSQLQQTLSRMRGKKVEPAPTVGVSVATDKEPVAPVAEPAPDVAPIDIGARQQAAKIQQQLNTLRQQQQRLQQPGIVDADSQKKIKDLQQQIKKLKQKFSKLQTTDNDVQNIIKLDTSSDQTDATGQGLFSPDQTLGDIFKSVDDTNLSPAAKKKSTKKKPVAAITEAGTRAGALNTCIQLNKAIANSQGKPAHEVDLLRRQMNALMRKYKITQQEINAASGPQASAGQQQQQQASSGQQQQAPRGNDWFNQMNQKYGFPNPPNAADPNWFKQHMAASDKMMQANQAELNKAFQSMNTSAPWEMPKRPMEQADENLTHGLEEALPAKALKQLYHWKNTQNEPQEPVQAQAEPQPVPARLSDLQAKQQRVANLASIKQEIERLQARATRGGRMLPRGLAADLEDYFTTANVDSAYDDMMAKYQKQLGALQQYLGMRKVLWSSKKDVHEMKINELNESGPETWTVHFTDGTTTKVRVPSDETDPAQVRAFFAKKGKTVKKFDYGFGVDQPAGPGPEAHEPGSGRAVSARTGDPLPEDVKLDRSGQKMYQAQEAYMIVHNGKEVAFYKPSEMKQAYADAEGLAKKFGGEVHVRKVVREGDIVKVDFRQGADAEAYRAYKQKRGDYFDKIARAANVGDTGTAERLRSELHDLESAARRRGLIK